MSSGSEIAGDHSPVRRRLIVLAGAGGLAGVAGILWPWRNEAVAGRGGEPAEAAVPDKSAETMTAAPSPTETVETADSGVAAERERFTRHLGEAFTAEAEGMTAVPLVLEEVGGLVKMFSGTELRFEGYALLFRARSGLLPEDGVYRLSHASLGDFDFYLGSVGGPADPARYEAVVSRAV